MHIVFDIGGTHTRIALSEDGNTLGTPIIISTPPAFTDGIKAIADTSHKLTNGKPVTSAGGGITGVLNADKTALHISPNLSDWAQKPLVRELENALQAPVRVGNDAALAGLGEATHGTGKDHNIVAFLTISTGIGGTRIVEKSIDANSFGFEPGHQTIVADGLVCSCGGKGHLEAYASGSGLQRQHNMKPEEITDQSIWNETARWVAIGIMNTLVHWSPDIVVLGGSLMKRLNVSEIENHVRKLNIVLPAVPPIRLAALNDMSALYGALNS